MDPLCHQLENDLRLRTLSHLQQVPEWERNPFKRASSPSTGLTMSLLLRLPPIRFMDGHIHVKGKGRVSCFQKKKITVELRYA